MLYLVLVSVTGVGLTFVSRMSWELEGRLAIGIPIGFGAVAMVTWLLAIPFGMSAMPLIIGAVLMVLGLGAALSFTGIGSRLRATRAMTRATSSRA